MSEEPKDDLTVVYLYAYEKGRDRYRAKNKKLREALEKMYSYNYVDAPAAIRNQIIDEALKENE